MSDENKVLPLPQDEYTGVGGAYVIDADGKRRPELPAPVQQKSDPQPPTEK